MSKELAEFVTQANIQIDSEGQLFVYVSDMLEGTDDCSTKAVQWACNVVNEEGVKEHNLALLVDLPITVDELLEFHNEGAEDAKEIPVSCKPQFDALRAQLVEAIARLDRIAYKY